MRPRRGDRLGELLEVLRTSRLLSAIRKRQPYSDNYLRPCMIIDNPDVLQSVVDEAKPRETCRGGALRLVRELKPMLLNYAARWESLRVSCPSPLPLFRRFPSAQRPQRAITYPSRWVDSAISLVENSRAAGGGMSTGGVFAVSGTIGQPDAGTLNGGSYTVQGGFWGGVALVQQLNAPRLFIQWATNLAVISWSPAKYARIARS